MRESGQRHGAIDRGAANRLQFRNQCLSNGENGFLDIVKLPPVLLQLHILHQNQIAPTQPTLHLRRCAGRHFSSAPKLFPSRLKLRSGALRTFNLRIESRQFTGGSSWGSHYYSANRISQVIDSAFGRNGLNGQIGPATVQIPVQRTAWTKGLASALRRGITR